VGRKVKKIYINNDLGKKQLIGVSGIIILY